MGPEAHAQWRRGGGDPSQASSRAALLNGHGGASSNAFRRDHPPLPHVSMFSFVTVASSGWPPFVGLSPSSRMPRQRAAGKASRQRWSEEHPDSLERPWGRG